jgi:hypothetical protein
MHPLPGKVQRPEWRRRQIGDVRPVWQTFHSFRIGTGAETVVDACETEICRTTSDAAGIRRKSAGSGGSSNSACEISPSDADKESRRANHR